MDKDTQKENTIARVNNMFTFHPASEGQALKYAKIRQLCLDLALDIIELTPASREQTIALNKLDEVMFYANAAIARNT